MGYLITQMFLYLTTAAAIGFVVAWLIRGRLAEQERQSLVSQLAASEAGDERLVAKTEPAGKALGPPSD